MLADVAPIVRHLQGDEALLRFPQERIGIEVGRHLRRELALEARHRDATRGLRRRRRGDGLVAEARVLHAAGRGLGARLQERAGDERNDDDRGEPEQDGHHDRAEIVAQQPGESETGSETGECPHPGAHRLLGAGGGRGAGRGGLLRRGRRGRLVGQSLPLGTSGLAAAQAAGFGHVHDEDAGQEQR